MSSSFGRWAIAGLVALVLIGGGALWSGRLPQSEPDAAPAPIAVTLGASKAVTAALAWIAAEQGFFAEAGVDATLKGFAFGKAAADALVEGEVDLCTTAEFVVAKMAAAHPDLRILSTVGVSHDIRLVVRGDGAVRSVRDLAGKRIGLTKGSNAEFFLSRLLILNGLSPKAVERVHLLPPAMADAVAEGKVDGAIVWQPHVKAIVDRLAGEALTFDGQPDQDYYFLLVGREPWLAKNAEAARRVVAALKMAEDWSLDHPEALKDILRAWIGGAGEPDDHRLSVGLPFSLGTILSEEMRWLTRKGGEKTAGRGIPDEPDILDLVDPRALRTVAPETVTLVR